jgi:hypothetical protein
MVGHFEERLRFSPLRVTGAPGLLWEIRGKRRIVASGVSRSPHMNGRPGLGGPARDRACGVG